MKTTLYTPPPQRAVKDAKNSLIPSDPTCWISRMRVLLVIRRVAGSIPAGFGNIHSWILIVKYFLRLFSLFRWFKKGSYQFLSKECAQVLVNRSED